MVTTIRKPRRPPLTPDQKVKIIELWKLGFGAPTIALKLKCFTSPVTEYLNSLGMNRSKKEMIELRKLNNIHCRVRANDFKDTPFDR